MGDNLLVMVNLPRSENEPVKLISLGYYDTKKWESILMFIFHQLEKNLGAKARDKTSFHTVSYAMVDMDKPFEEVLFGIVIPYADFLSAVTK